MHSLLTFNFQLLTCLLALTACTFLEEPPPPTMTAPPSGPTIAPSPIGFPVLPTEIPPDFIASGQNDPTAAALPRDSGMPPLVIGTPGIGRQPIEITAQDGALIYGELFQVGTERLPGVLVIGGNRADWGEFPAQLQRAGFTVLVMEMRAQASVADFQVMMDALNTGMVDPARIGVIGSGAGADLALLGCAENLSCDALVLLSPLGEQGLGSAMLNYNARPVFISASQDDSAAFATAQSLEAASSGEKFFQPFESAGRGAELIRNRSDLGDLIIGWLTRYLIEMP